MFQDPTVRKVGIGVMVLLALFLLAKTLGEFKEYRFIGSDPSLRGTITVSGEAERTVKPDIARFTFSVSEDHTVVATAQERAAKKTNSIIAFLKEQGIEEKDIKTTGYNIYPRYNYSKQGASYYPYPDGGRTLAGYTVSQSVEVTVRTIDKAGDLLSGVGSRGATDVSSLWFEVDNQEEILAEVKEEAIRDAREKAKGLAGALGVKVSRIVSYSDGGYPIYYAKGYDMALQEAGAGSANGTPSIPGGENLIKATVSITYEIK